MAQTEISPELKGFICEGFWLIKRSSDYDYKQKVDLLGILFSMGAGTGWRPKQITLNALHLFVDNEFNLPRGLERAHIYHRRDTMKELLERKWENDEWRMENASI